MIEGAPSAATVDRFDSAVEDARRLTGLRLDTLTRAVVDQGDTVGWARLEVLGTRAIVEGQTVAIGATSHYLTSTLADNGIASAPVQVPVRPGVLASGRPVAGMLAITPDVVAARVDGGASFADALAASAKYLAMAGASDVQRIKRDGPLSAGLADPRFARFRRVAAGDTCSFCLMLATRGAVYLTRESAGEARRYHHRCDCRIEMVVGSDAITESTGLQGDWRNAITDEQRLVDIGAVLRAGVRIAE